MEKSNAVIPCTRTGSSGIVKFPHGSAIKVLSTDCASRDRIPPISGKYLIGRGSFFHLLLRPAQNESGFWSTPHSPSVLHGVTCCSLQSAGRTAHLPFHITTFADRPCLTGCENPSCCLGLMSLPFSPEPARGPSRWIGRFR